MAGMIDKSWLHFAGIAGSGMSALAQFHVRTGGFASGSDRSFDRGGAGAIRAALEALGIRIVPQDGSFPESARIPGACAGMVVSTAVEETVPDVRTARAHGIPILHRSELLARFVSDRRTIAVTGTSGKSTVTAMIFEILRGVGRDPSVITGGDLVLLQEQGHLGNAWAGSSDLLVIEADESDGSLTRYAPWAGVLLNLQRDHKEPEELAGIFRVFRERTRGPFLAAEDANLDPFASGAVRFGLGEAADVRAVDIDLGPDGSRFAVLGPPVSGIRPFARFELPSPGLHNVRNAVAAIGACLACGVPLEKMPPALRGFRGVGRRFQVVGRARGIEVVDDFAHNPEKIRAALATARMRAGRILAVYQPHGFGPTRFLRDGLIEAFAEMLGPGDHLYMPEIFYAGGTAARDISSKDIVEAVAARGVPASFGEDRPSLVPQIAAEAAAGDCVLVMGARDPSLTTFCRDILAAVEAATGGGETE